MKIFIIAMAAFALTSCAGNITAAYKEDSATLIQDFIDGAIPGEEGFGGLPVTGGHVGVDTSGFTSGGPRTGPLPIGQLR